MPSRRPDIEEYKQLVREYDALPPRTRTFRHEEDDPRYRQFWDAILTHPLDSRGPALARTENEREDVGDPYWGVPHFDIEIIEGGFEVDVTFPSPGIKRASDETDYGTKYKCLTCWGVERLKKKQRKRWDAHARRLIKLGMYDKEAGWPDAEAG